MNWLNLPIFLTLSHFFIVDIVEKVGYVGFEQPSQLTHVARCFTKARYRDAAADKSASLSYFFVILLVVLAVLFCVFLIFGAFYNIFWESVDINMVPEAIEHFDEDNSRSAGVEIKPDFVVLLL